MLKEYFEIIVNFNVKRFDLSVLSSENVWGSWFVFVFYIVHKLYCSLECWGWGGIAIHHVQVQSKES